MDAAYSLEYGDIIDAEKAYDLFQAGIIQNKKAFGCLDENCNAQVTCVNIDRPIQETKKSVHFRVYGEHIKGCRYNTSQIIKRNIHLKNSEEQYSKLANVHIISLRPKDYYTLEKASFLKNEDTEQSKNSKKKKYHSDINTNKPKTHYWIAPIITRYLDCYVKYKNALNNRYIQMSSNVQIPFSQFFVPIDNQEFSTLSKYPKIYFGEAFLGKANGKKIQIKFTSSFILNGKLTKPAIELDLDKFKEYGNYNYWKKRLDIVANKKHSYLFFVYGVPKDILWKDDRKNIQLNYIRFITSNPDYMDLRIIDSPYAKI